MKQKNNNLTSLDTILDNKYGKRGATKRENWEQEFEAFRLGVLLEEARIKIRQLRDDFLKMVKKDFENNEISEDEMFSFKKELQKKIEEINQELENIEEQKIKEIENS